MVALHNMMVLAVPILVLTLLMLDPSIARSAGAPMDDIAYRDTLPVDGTNLDTIVPATVASPADSIRHDSTSPGPDYLPGPLDMFANLPSDWADWTVQYVTLKNLPLIGAIGVVTTALVLTDYETLEPLSREYKRSNTVRQVSDAAVFIGDGKFQFGLALAFAGYGLIADDKRAIRTGSQVTEVILACGGVVQLLKHLTGRESPFAATTPTGRWDLFPNQIEYAKHVPHYDAFPSGHVATALATLTVITENYPEESWIKWVGYPAIGALAVGMVASGIHWWSDYPLSIALGYTFGRLVASRGALPTSSAGTSSYSNGTGFRYGITIHSNGSPAAMISYVW